MISLTISTATAFAFKVNEPEKLVFVRHEPTKHLGRLTLPGGKIRTDGTMPESAVQAVVRELFEEAGGSPGSRLVIGEPILAAIAADPLRDPRLKPLQEMLPDLEGRNQVRCLYGVPDYWYAIPVFEGRPAINRGLPNNEQEAVAAFYQDVHYLELPGGEMGTLAAGHDVAAHWYLAQLLPEIKAHPDRYMRRANWPEHWLAPNSQAEMRGFELLPSITSVPVITSFDRYREENMR